MATVVDVIGPRPGVSSIRDVSAAEFITAYSQHLKKSGKLTLPEWVDYVKTACGRELPPLDADWYYVRAASLARKVYLNQGIGVGALARWYGGSKRNGTKPQRHHSASRKIIRTILIQLEQLDILAKDDKGRRYLTQNGQKELDTVARASIEA